MSPLTLAWMAISTSRLRSKRSFKASLDATAPLLERPTSCPPAAEEVSAEENLVAVSVADMLVLWILAELSILCYGSRGGTGNVMYAVRFPDAWP